MGRARRSRSLFLALAAGSILYVVIELVNVNRRGVQAIIAWIVLLGLFLGFATEFVVEAAGV